MIQKRHHNLLPATGEVTSYEAGDDNTYRAGKPGTRMVSVTISGDDVVSDKHTGLMWVKDPEGDLTSGGWPGVQTWSTGLSSCEGLSFAGFTDWRMPNLFELISLYDANKAATAIIDPFVGNALVTWTSTTRKASDTNAHGLFFTTRLSVSTFAKSGTAYVRPVRGGRLNA
jgi:hypothetical protein